MLSLQQNPLKIMLWVAMRGMMLVWAELDNNIRSERTSTGLRAAFKAGRCPWKAKSGYEHTIC